MKSKNIIYRFMGLASLAILTLGSGPCDFFKRFLGCSDCHDHGHSHDSSGGVSQSRLIVNKEDGSPVLLRFHDGSMVTEKSFDERVLSVFASMMPVDQLGKEQKKMIFDNVLRTLIIKKHFGDKAMGSEESRVAFAHKVEALAESVALEYFVNELKADLSVSESDARSTYEKNKDRYVKSSGGILTVGARFGSAEDAQAFEESVSASGLSLQEFEKQGKSSGKAFVRNFGRISKGMCPGVPSEIVNAAQSVYDYPAMKIINVNAEGSSGGDVWVVMFVDKKDPEHFEFNEIKDRIIAMETQRKFEEEVEKRIDSLKDQYVSEVNESYFAGSGMPMGMLADQMSEE